MATRIEIQKNGGPERLVPVSFEPEEAPEGKVRIEVAAAGVNWADVMMRMGLYPDAPPRPYAPGYEVAGTVVEAPKGSGLRRGQRVAALTRFGGYTSVVDVDPVQAIPIPTRMTFEQAAAMPVVYYTAWAALHESARVRPGDKILVHGGAGGVGLAVIAMGEQAGCTVYATAGGPEKVAWLEENTTVEQAFDYRAAPFREQVLDAAGPMDVVMDPIGGDHVKESLKTCGLHGRVIGYGASATAAKGKFSPVQALKTIRQMKLSVIPLFRHNVGIQGLYALPLAEADPEGLRDTLVGIMKDVVGKKVAGPTIAASFPLSEASEAHRYLQQRRNIGKVVLTV